MKVTVCSSSNENINDKYYESSKKVLNYLTTIKDIELIFGTCSKSIMGLSYKIFNEKNLNIHAYTTHKYSFEIDNLKGVFPKIFDSTFDLKNSFFKDSDFILFLPGGTGTVSEFFSFLEEIVSNDVNKTLILYNEDNHFDSTISLINDLVNRNFTNSSIFDKFKVVTSINELEDIIKENEKN